MSGRIRTIKPELIATQRFAERTDAAKVLFLGCYSLADDAGNCPAGPTYLAGNIFWARPRGAIVIGRLLGELETARLIDRYLADGAPHLAILGWAEKSAPTHQRIEKSRILRFPRPKTIRSWNEFPERSDPDTDTDTDSDTDRDTDPESVSLSPYPPPLPVGWEPPAGGVAELLMMDLAGDGEIDVLTSMRRFIRWWNAHPEKRTADADARFALWLENERPANTQPRRRA